MHQHSDVILQLMAGLQRASAERRTSTRNRPGLEQLPQASEPAFTFPS